MVGGREGGGMGGGEGGMREGGRMEGGGEGEFVARMTEKVQHIFGMETT